MHRARLRPRPKPNLNLTRSKLREEDDAPTPASCQHPIIPSNVDECDSRASTLIGTGGSITTTPTAIDPTVVDTEERQSISHVTTSPSYDSEPVAPDVGQNTGVTTTPPDPEPVTSGVGQNTDATTTRQHLPQEPSISEAIQPGDVPATPFLKPLEPGKPPVSRSPKCPSASVKKVTSPPVKPFETGSASECLPPPVSQAVLSSLSNSPRRDNVRGALYPKSASKTSFKPTLDLERAPKFTFPTYGKMGIEAKHQMLKKFGTLTPELDKLTMLDLIFFTPPSQKKHVADTTIQIASNDDGPKQVQSASSPISVEDSVQQLLEDAVDVPQVSESDLPHVIQSAVEKAALPVPRLTVNPDGTIVIAPESLLVKSKQPQEPSKRNVVVEDEFSKPKIKKKIGDRQPWSTEETVKFYKALHALGSDFHAMMSLFPGRSRRSLKCKFKREEKMNASLVDMVMTSQYADFNVATLQKELAITNTYHKLIQKVRRNGNMMNLKSSVPEPKGKQPADHLTDRQVAERRKERVIRVPRAMSISSHSSIDDSEVSECSETDSPSLEDILAEAKIRINTKIDSDELKMVHSMNFKQKKRGRGVRLDVNQTISHHESGENGKSKRVCYQPNSTQSPELLLATDDAESQSQDSSDEGFTLELLEPDDLNEDVQL